MNANDVIKMAREITNSPEAEKWFKDVIKDMSLDELEEFEKQINTAWKECEEFWEEQKNKGEG